VDLIESYGQLAFNLDFYTEVQDLGRLVYSMDLDRFGRRFQKLSSGLCEARDGPIPCTMASRADALISTYNRLLGKCSRVMKLQHCI